MIDTIFFDVGNTLRIVVEDEDFARAAEEELMKLVGTTEPHDEFFEKLETRWTKYRKSSKAGALEASEMELWSQYMLPDYPIEHICSVAGRLTRLWRDHDGRRVPRPDVKDTLFELDRRGYVMGIIANTITETEIPDWMISDGVAGLFRSVILSSKVRIRKPDPEIHLLAARTVGKPPENCAYIGDNPIRDVDGCRGAGYGLVVCIFEPETLHEDAHGATQKPDHIITTISQLLDIFPPLQD